MHKIILTMLHQNSTSLVLLIILASRLIHFTGVPLGYYSHICTTKVSQSVHVYRLLICCIFSIYRSLWNMRNYIHCMLCGSMFTAQLLFIVGIDKTENEVL